MLFQQLASILTLTYYQTRLRHPLRVFQQTTTILIPYPLIFAGSYPRWAVALLRRSYRDIAMQLYIHTAQHVDIRVNRLNWPKVEEIKRFQFVLIQVTRSNPV